jgi:hypothetical protein
MAHAELRHINATSRAFSCFGLVTKTRSPNKRTEKNPITSTAKKNSCVDMEDEL